MRKKEESPAPCFGRKTKILDFISELQNYLQGIKDSIKEGHRWRIHIQRKKGKSI